MRSKPAVEYDLIQKLSLSRWDQFSKFNPIKCCRTCRYFDKTNIKCTEKENKETGYNVNLSFVSLELESYNCGSVSIDPKLELYIKENPYKNLTYKEENMMRHKFETEIDIDIHRKQRSNQLSLSINAIDLDKIEFLKTKIWFTGYVIPFDNHIPKHIDNILAGRQITRISYPINAIDDFVVYKNGDITHFNSVEEFQKFIEQEKIKQKS
jgi:hypothetical protein